MKRRSRKHAMPFCMIDTLPRTSVDTVSSPNAVTVTSRPSGTGASAYTWNDCGSALPARQWLGSFVHAYSACDVGVIRFDAAIAARCTDSLWRLDEPLSWTDPAVDAGDGDGDSDGPSSRWSPAASTGDGGAAMASVGTLVHATARGPVAAPAVPALRSGR